MDIDEVSIEDLKKIIRDREKRDKELIKFLRENSKEVDKWPDWKKNSLGNHGNKR